MCGESLDPETPQGSKRLNYIESAVKQAIEQGQQSRTLADIKYVARELYTSSLSANGIWRNKFHDIFTETTSNLEFLEEKMEESRELSNKIALIPNVDVSNLVDKRIVLNRERDNLRLEQDRKFRKISKLKQQYLQYEKEKKELLRNEKLNVKILSELEASQDLLTIFLSSYATIMNIELQKVSQTMNQYFLEMIGTSSENKNTIIVNSEITQNFDIKVYGPNNKSLDPDEDLNGASRRALTISLILALTTVSGIKAPNIIDTPLGMMSGHVKRFVTELFIKYSSQPILFLTRDEISGCEDIIAKYLGAITTLTNPAHYPKSLKNEQQTENIQVISCRCDHTQYCKTCERIDDTENPKLTRLTSV